MVAALARYLGERGETERETEGKSGWLSNTSFDIACGGHEAQVKKKEHIYEQQAFIHPTFHTLFHEENLGNSQLFP